MADNIFRAYDIRGIVGLELTEHLAEKIAMAIAHHSIQKKERGVVIARDGRLSSADLSEAIKNGLKRSGCHVIDIGMVPTPLLYYATHSKGATSGVMVTGSHNPPHYNGFKIMIAGETLFGARIEQLKETIKNNQWTLGAGSDMAIDIKQDYIDQVNNNIKLKRKLKVVIDCGNGVGGIIAPALYRKLGCEVIELFCQVNGNFPNHHPDPSQIENLVDLQKNVINHQADLGLAFDGDGDRLGVVDNQGNIILPDRQLMLFAQTVLKNKRGEKIIYDVKCSNLLTQLIKENQGIGIMSKTGHSYIKQSLKQEKAALAGEMSGHIFFNDRWYGFDDALYAGARLLEIIADSKLDCAAIFAEIPKQISTTELQIKYPNEGEQFSAMKTLIKNLDFSDATIQTIDGIRVEYADAWGLVRPSNTTPCLVLRFEAKNEQALARIDSAFKAWFQRSNVTYLNKAIQPT